MWKAVFSQQFVKRYCRGRCGINAMNRRKCFARPEEAGAAMHDGGVATSGGR